MKTDTGEKEREWPFLTHTLCCAANCRVAVSGSLLVSLDLLADLGLDLVRAAGNKIFSSLVQTAEPFLKTGYFLHQRLRRNSQMVETFLSKYPFTAKENNEYSGFLCFFLKSNSHYGSVHLVTG